MRELRFVALAEDGAHIVVIGETGEHFRIRVDERLKAAARGDAARLGQLEIHMESSLRPAEIQARVRAGQSPDELARESSMPVERVLRFAGPVLQERAMVADRAQRTRVRPTEPGAPAPLLGELVETRLAALGIDPQTVAWDAVRREDGTWRITAQWTAGGAPGCAVFGYDPTNKHVTTTPEGARALLGPRGVASPAGEAAIPGGADRRADRPFALLRSAPQVTGGSGQPVDLNSRPVEGGTAADEPADEEQPGRQAVASGDGTRPRRRPAVPAWDEIVFGARHR